MLVIRENQVAAFAQALRKVFQTKLERYLRQIAEPPESFPGELFDVQMPAFIDLAKQAGIQSEADMASLAEYVFRATGGFNIRTLSKRHQNIIYEYRVPPAVKLQRLKELDAH